MNPNTRVAVCCYAGDAHQVEDLMPLYAHHECPITILSPADSPVQVGDVAASSSGIEALALGKRAIIGQDSLDRQALHLKVLLAYQEHHFLINDSDSFCLSPVIPAYLYAEPDILWSNMITDSNAFRAGLCRGPSGEPTKKYYPDGFPKLALQPAYFMSRRVLERLVHATRFVTINPHLPFIDHYMTQLAVHAGVTCKGYTNGWSGPISSHPDMPPLAAEAARRGIVMFHGAKDWKWAAPLVEGHKQFCRKA